MTIAPYHLPTGRTERAIAVARVVLASTSLFAIWLDPAEPARYVAMTYTLHAIYVAYSVVLMGVMLWDRSSLGRLPIVTHVADIILFSVFQYLTLGPSSPFFVYFIFSLFCGALRWGWRGTLATSAAVTSSYVVMGASMSRTLGPTEFELNRFLIRSVYLAVTGALLVYLGQHEIRLRREIERLARWPAASGLDSDAVLTRVLEYATQLLGARRAMVVWDAEEEPWARVASWSASKLVVTKHGPAEFDPMVPADLTDAVVLCPSPLDDTSVSLVCVGERSFDWHGVPLHRHLLSRLGGVGLASAPFRTERGSGRVFFSDLGEPTAESIALTEVVARNVGESIDQLEVAQQLREIGAREQRIRLARDLHDGVLQSLTGVRLELQAVASSGTQDTSPADRDRLLAIERAVAIEQRELRLFIDGLKPALSSERQGALASSLRALGDRVALEWKIPLAIRIDPQPIPLSETLAQAVPFMAHEAIVNALKHAQPSRISLDVSATRDMLRLVVTDDGHGFTFQGRYEHATLTEMNLGPVSLRDRVASLGGHLTIESSGAGSRVEIAVPIEVGER